MTKNYLNKYFKSIKNKRYRRQRAGAFCLFVISVMTFTGAYFKSNPIVKVEDSYVCEMREPFSGTEGDFYKISVDLKRLEVTVSHEKTTKYH